MNDERLRLHATCDAGLEEVLQQELEAVGAHSCKRVPRGVSFRGNMTTLWRANLESRIANRILMEIGFFQAKTRDQLYAGVQSIPWSAWMTPYQSIAVDSRTSETPNLNQTMFINQVVKDGICDQFRRNTNRRPNVARRNPDIPIMARINGGRVIISLDASGEWLHRRGYRTHAGEAPLRETLAAGLLALAQWRGDKPLVDPMCGSGTIVIEGALIARKIAPGLLRLRREETFAFQRWRTFHERGFKRLVDSLHQRILPQCPVPIVGSDNDTQVLKHARHNAGRAGVKEAVTFHHRSLQDAEPPGESGVLLTNPPYGERLGDIESLESLYKGLGDRLKQRFQNHTAFVIAGEPALVKRIGLRASRRHPVFNGAIECRLLKFELYAGTRDKKKANTPSS